MNEEIKILASTEILLQKAKDKSLEIQFFTLEYWKRKCESECEHYANINNLCETLKLEYCEFIKKEKIQMNNNDIDVFLLQQAYSRFFCGEKNILTEKSANEKFIKFIMENEILNIFFDISFNYNYYVCDLVKRYDLIDVFKSGEFPRNLGYHLNGNNEYNKQNDYLSLYSYAYCNNYNSGNIQEKIYEQYFKCKYEYGKTINIDNAIHCTDFLIFGRVLDNRFNLEDAHKKIKDHLTYVLFEQKCRAKKELTEYEFNEIVKLYDNDANGCYGETHVISRIIGLLLWDIVKHENIKVAKASRQLIENDIIYKNYSGSLDEKNFHSLYKNTERCITEGKVLAMNRKRGRPAGK